MQLFSEWSNFRTSHQAQTDWVYLPSEGKEEGRKFLDEEGKNLFNDFQLEGTYQDGDRAIFKIKGSPRVTLFELENLEIFPDN